MPDSLVRIEWTDADGQLQVLPSLAPRLSSFTPTHAIIGPRRTPLGGGAPRLYEFRTDEGDTFGIPHIAHNQLGQLIALKAFMDNGGKCLVYPGGVDPSPLDVYLSEGAEIGWTLDTATLEYTAQFNMDLVDPSNGPALSPYQGPIWSLDPGISTSAVANARTDAALEWVGNAYVSVAANVNRVSHRLADGVRKFVVEPAATNLLIWSADFSNAVWTGEADFTRSDVASVIPGETAQLNINDGGGSRARVQAFGSLGSAPVVVSFDVERMDAQECRVGVQDLTGAGFVAQADFDLLDGTITPQAATEGSAQGYLAERLAEVGPNGGAMWRLHVWGTPDTPANTGRAVVYPSGAGTNTLGAVLHHGQGVVSAGVVGRHIIQPLVSQGTVGSHLANDATAAFTDTPRPMTGYARFTWMGDAGNAFPRLIQIGSAINPGDGEWLLFVYNQAADLWFTEIIVRLADGTQDIGAGALLPAGLATTIGDEVELLAVLDQNLDVTISTVVAGVTTTVGPVSDPNISNMPSRWGGDLISIGQIGGSSDTCAHFERISVAAGVQSWATMRGLR